MESSWPIQSLLSKSFYLPIFLFFFLISTGNAAETKRVHVFVALCDNEHQGIVPTTKTLGDGANPRTNLYWGAMYGVPSLFRKSKGWKKEKLVLAPDRKEILARCAFSGHGVFMLAEAYDGRFMKRTILDFLGAAAGSYEPEFSFTKGEKSKWGGAADLVVFIGHNGLMDFSLDSLPPVADKGPAGAIVLACKSNSHFSPILLKYGCTPLVMTKGFMAPEAYTLEAVLRSWSKGEDVVVLRKAAAQAYSDYQKQCSLAAASRLFLVPKTKTPQRKTGG